MSEETKDRELARRVTIDAVEPIENADAIERIRVGGWTVVSQKGNFEPGDEAVYFEVDSQLPLDDERFAFLAKRGESTRGDGERVHRLKTARLRGVYSQGLLLPLSLFTPLELEDPDLTSALGVTKYEPPLPQGTNAIGPFTPMVRRTDSERAQNLAVEWPAIIAHSDWVATEKIDGTSLTVYCDEFGGVHVYSRNWELGEGGDLYWTMARESGIAEFLHPGMAVQGEIFGEGIQGNPLGIAGRRVAVFSWLVDGLNVPRGNGSPGWDELAGHPSGKCVLAPVYEGLELPGTVEGAIAQVDGLKSLVSPQRLAEGVVWHARHAEGPDALSGRTTFKAINNKYLLKHDG